jgi:hypothetical protein
VLLRPCYALGGMNRGIRTQTLIASATAAITLATTLAACGSSSPNSGGRTNPSQAQAQQATLSFARCMRTHGVSNFPDSLDYRNIPGINQSSPAFRAAQTGCAHLLPVKTGPPAAAPSARTEAELLHLTNCLRTHGYPTIPDPKPDPPPAGGSPGANRYGTLYGQGDYWIGIPTSINAHGAAFVRIARACGATGV